MSQPARFQVQESDSTRQEKCTSFATFQEAYQYALSLQDPRYNTGASTRSLYECWQSDGYYVDTTPWCQHWCISAQALIVALNPAERGLLSAVVQGYFTGDDGPARVYQDWLQEHELTAPLLLPGEDILGQGERLPLIIGH
jgi:hypothetical protein